MNRIARRTALVASIGALGLGVSAPGAFAAHAGEYHSTSKGNGKCHDVGNRSADGDQNAKGHGRASQNENSAISPFSCDAQPS
ncbi:hypothetical protein BH24ACT23_BH24ACT23_12570 [soil metagenome]